MISVKPPTTYENQIEKLRSRGCIIDDEPEAIQILSKINYYRFTAYFLPLKGTDDQYNQGTNFKTVYQIYEFDRKIRHIIFSAIEEIEIFVRAIFAYHHAHTFGALGYLDYRNYNQRHNHTGFIAKINNEIEKQSKELFVQHHISKYNGQFPIWAIIELFSFGTLSHFYADLPTSSQKHLAKTFFNTHQSTLESWLHCGTVIRNICAHFGRLYYRKFPVVPKGITGLDPTNERSLFGRLLAIRELYIDTEKWNKEIFDSIKNLVAEYSADIQLKHIGFPADWEAKLMR